jgi:hypothetical protein
MSSRQIFCAPRLAISSVFIGTLCMCVRVSRDGNLCGGLRDVRLIYKRDPGATWLDQSVLDSETAPRPGAGVGAEGF